MNDRPERKSLPHGVPPWVAEGSIYFVTMNSLPRGGRQLTEGDMPQLLWNSISFNTRRGVWWPHLVLVMPDHLHALMSFPIDPGMLKVLRSWKHFTSRIHGVTWQRDFFDHRLRDDESYVEKAHYIRQNPVRKGLVGRVEEWPHLWTMAHG